MEVAAEHNQSIDRQCIADLQLEHNCALSGMYISALPPGSVDIEFSTTRHLVDINLNSIKINFAIASDKAREMIVPQDSVAWYPPNVSFKMKACNQMWGLLLEIDPKRANDISPEFFGDREISQPLQFYKPNPRAALLGKLMIEHLRHSVIDPLYIEGLALATYSSSLALNQLYKPASTVGTDNRIHRVIEYLDSNFGKPLSVAELAEVAGMSPSYFSQCFKAITGEAVWVFVQRLRCEKSYDMLLFTEDPIAVIAHQCGFSSQAHLTTTIKAKYGSTPLCIRKQHR